MADGPEPGEQIHKAIEESKRTGKSVELMGRMCAPVEKKGVVGKRTKVEKGEADGDGVKDILEGVEKKEREGNAGHFKIVEKTYNEEEETYSYRFEWDEDFALYALESMGKPDLSPEEMDTFCLAILVARQEGELTEGVKVKQVEDKKRRKFYKKYS